MNWTEWLVLGALDPVSRSSFAPLPSSSVRRIGFREQSIPSFRTSRWRFLRTIAPAVFSCVEVVLYIGSAQPVANQES
jgi:hypothetical protein